jgi:hypothetical protein
MPYIVLCGEAEKYFKICWECAIEIFKCRIYQMIGERLKPFSPSPVV